MEYIALVDMCVLRLKYWLKTCLTLFLKIHSEPSFSQSHIFDDAKCLPVKNDVGVEKDSY